MRSPLLLLLLAGCSSFSPPTALTLAKVAPMALAGLLPGRFELELTTPSLTGTFDAICVVEASSFRLQLFPDVGGKVLDLVVCENTVTADMPGSRYEAKAPLAAAPPHLGLALAALLAELLAPVGPDRVVGERQVAGAGVEVQLRPALGSGSVSARLSAAGSIESYAIQVGWIEFVCTAAGEIRGRGVAGQLRRVGG